jgi:hypothetical protein
VLPEEEPEEEPGEEPGEEGRAGALARLVVGMTRNACSEATEE